MTGSSLKTLRDQLAIGIGLAVLVSVGQALVTFDESSLTDGSTWIATLAVGMLRAVGQASLQAVASWKAAR